MDVAEAALRAGAAEAAERATELARSLVRIDTRNPYCGDADAPPGELEGQRFLERLLREAGARVETFDCPDDVYARGGIIGPRERDFRGRPNLAATFDFGRAGPVGVLQAHMDTVGTAGMTVPPFEGAVRDGRLWGRGASDCKGAMAGGLGALLAFVGRRLGRAGAVRFQSVIEEECSGGGAGSLAACLRLPRPDYAVVCDGDGPAVFRGYSGTLTLDVAVPGVGGHPAHPEGTSNAIRNALAVLAGIDRWGAAHLARSPLHTVNLGVFHGGTTPVVVPSACRLAFNITYGREEAVRAEQAGAGYGAALLRAAIERHVREAEAGDPFLREHPSALTWVKDLLPFETPADDALVTDLLRLEAAELGATGTAQVGAAWSDACYPAAVWRIPTVVYGAGAPGAAHAENEYTDLWRVQAAARVLFRLLAERHGTAA